ncbi:polysaccharide deacetylase, putative [Heliomicrobium modesticaldum Ice1]|uniref:Polysaccharide deacetylase, putative n=1 Tax=Heliobacterium modesticaldum (strain ATCC 51547 / Ice1) TaxID=498761 RepID=B0TA84_HELMI|nr:polysaccharide deacetylase family protein [Heliomicrobium modesticaldum]ABZ83621.1 polysaccharide deacetylase, putative [Heliomicrobium modesticaldum Ice1]
MQGDGLAAAEGRYESAEALGGGQPVGGQRLADKATALQLLALFTLVALLALLGQAGLVNQALTKQQNRYRSEIETLRGQVRQLNEQVEQLQREKERLRSVQYPNRNGLITENVPEKKTAYLTFDDGPSENTLAVLDILAQYQVKATFFVNGNATDFGRAAYRRIAREGHALGNHTYSHLYGKVYASIEAFMEDVRRLDELIAEETGIRPDILRFPGGSNNRVSPGRGFMVALSRRVVEAGYQYFDWNVDSLDASKATPDKDLIVNAVARQSAGQKAVIVLFHDSPAKKTTVEALPEIIERLQHEGYSFDVLGKSAYAVKFL